MNNKEKALVAISVLVGFGVAALVISMTLGAALAQDQNPPTTGKTTPNVTSTFGPNLPTTKSVGNTTASVARNTTK